MTISGKYTRYKRAFDWRLTPGAPDGRSTAAQALVALGSSEYPDILEDYLDISRKRRTNRTAIAKLQLHLIDELILTEQAIKHYRNKKDELKNNASSNDTVEDTADAETNLVDSELFSYRALANGFRSIADGIAWRALRYDRAVLRVLCQNRGSQRILSPGIAEELREFSRQFDNGVGIAVLNSLTNWLAFGDVSVIKDDGSVEILEVKSSKTSSGRIVRQKQRMREVVNFLANGAGEIEDKPVEVLTLDILPENDLGGLRKLLEAAETDGLAAARISDAVYVECVDFAELDGSNKLRERFLEERKVATADWDEKKDFIHDSNSLNHIAFSPNLAPFSVFPFPSRLCIDLLVGRKAYVVRLNVTRVEAEFENCGWHIKRGIKEMVSTAEGELTFLEVGKDGFYCSIPPGTFMRLSMELLRPRVLIRQCEDLLAAGPGTLGSEFGLIVYGRENEVWD